MKDNTELILLIGEMKSSIESIDSKLGSIDKTIKCVPVHEQRIKTLEKGVNERTWKSFIISIIGGFIGLFAGSTLPKIPK